ncbi:MAG: molybdopterin-binding protein [Candidatus Aramenus sp.]|jgi:molybdopterin molybdotransferase|nr:molybdopterin-binding protein [Candidatus Aramenus sp.]
MRAILPEDSLLSAEEALSIFEGRLPPRPLVVSLPLLDALGKASAEDVFSPIDLPPFSRSTVDGFALRAEDTPGTLRVVGKVPIGEYKELKVSRGEAVEVDTGSLLPEGANAVVKVEEVDVKGNEVVVKGKVRFGQNVAWVGSDVPRGFQLLKRGEVITPEKVAALASVGVKEVKVYSPRVYVIVTGDELVEPGEKLDKGKVYESNAHYLLSRLRDYVSVGYFLVRDDKEEIRKALENALSMADVVILTGGTSAGEKDYVHQVIREMGEIVVHGIKFKPGKPTILAVVKGKPVFGLPGNVVSTIMVYEQVIRKYLDRMASLGQREEAKVKAKALLPAEGDKRRFTYLPVYLLHGKDSLYFLSVPFDSHMIGTFSSADGYIVLPPGARVEEDQEAEVVVKVKEVPPTLLGEEDVSFKDVELRKVFLGSYPACKALEKGVGEVLVVSSLVCEPKDYTYSFDRDVLVNGEGEEVGYHEWVGMSRLVKNPSVRLKSPSTAPYFLGRAKVYAPRGYIEGQRAFTERIYVVSRIGKFQ